MSVVDRRTMDTYITAIIDLNQQTKPNILDTARRHGIERSALSRRFRGTQGTKAQQYVNNQLLNRASESTLINHISTLTIRSISPTPAMVQSFGAEIARQEPGLQFTGLQHRMPSLQIENRVFMAALSNEKKKIKRGKTVIEEIRDEGQHEGIFWSPKKIERARTLQQQKDNEAAQHKATMATRKALKRLNIARQLVAKQQRALEREHAHEEKAQAIEKECNPQTREGNVLK